jgi:DNA polymerase-3 subunit gamma/tau
MSKYVVSALKYRPRRFDDVVGQPHIVNTLKSAVQTNHVAHAFLFCGPRGVGKTTCARILARVINCENLQNGADPCGTCAMCTSFEKQASFNIFELDAASHNNVDSMRSLVEQVRYQPQHGRYKVYIIDEAHMLTTQAFNAFLKTLEEPPPYAIFILATTEKHKILPTILSRCQIFDFRRITVKDMVAHLETIAQQEGIKTERDALVTIAQKSDGALRDALSLFDRLAGAAENNLTYQSVVQNLNLLDYEMYFQIADACLREDVRDVLLTYDMIVMGGFEGDMFLDGLAAHYRDLLVCRDPAMLSLQDHSDELRDRYGKQATLMTPSYIFSALNLINECDLTYPQVRNKRLHVEIGLTRICFLRRLTEGNPFASEKKN